MPFDWIIAYGMVIFLAIGIHEYAHCKVADLAGDPTPAFHGRVTLNLTKHFEPVGTMMIVLTTLTGFGIGWGRPAPINPSKMRNPRWDTMAAVLAGPISNILQAAVWAILLRVLTMVSPDILFDPTGHPRFFGLFLVLGVLVNIFLALFNLLPIGPLDGHWVIGQLLPEKPRLYWYRFNRGIGTYLMIALIIGPQILGLPSILGDFISPIAMQIFMFFVGSEFAV